MVNKMYPEVSGNTQVWDLREFGAFSPSGYGFDIAFGLSVESLDSGIGSFYAQVIEEKVYQNSSSNGKRVRY